MILFPNGHIELKEKSGGGINPETGFPIKPTEQWSESITCQYRANKYSNKGKSNGESFIIASYEIYIDELNFDSERLRLYDKNDALLGEFSVISKEMFELTKSVLILV